MTGRTGSMGDTPKPAAQKPDPDLEVVPDAELAEVEAPVEVQPDPDLEVVDEASEDGENEDDDGPLDLHSKDPNEELWEGGPTIGQTIAWKEAFGEVWVTTLNPYTNRHVMWRPIMRDEYRELVKLMEQAISSGMSTVEATMNNEEMMAERVCLFPTYRRGQPTLAGMPQTIAQEVMEISGFVAAEVRQL